MKLHGAEPKWTAWSMTEPVLSSPLHEFEQIKFYCVDAFHGHSHSKTCPCNPRFSSGGWIGSIQDFFHCFSLSFIFWGYRWSLKNALPNSTHTFANKFLHGSATSRPSWTKCALVATFLLADHCQETQWCYPEVHRQLSSPNPQTHGTQNQTIWLLPQSLKPMARWKLWRSCRVWRAWRAWRSWSFWRWSRSERAFDLIMFIHRVG